MWTQLFYGLLAKITQILQVTKLSKLRSSMTRDTGWRYSPVCWLTSDYASCPRTSGVAPRHCPAAVVSVAGKLSKNIWMSLSRCWPGPPRAARCCWWLLGSSCFVQLFMERCPDCPNLRPNQSDVMMGNSEDNVVMIRHYLPCFPKMKLQFRSINSSTKRRAASHPAAATLEQYCFLRAEWFVTVKMCSWSDKMQCWRFIFMHKFPILSSNMNPI